MASTRVEYDWSQTAGVLAMLYNRTIFTRGTPPKKPSDFMPNTPRSPDGGKTKTRLTPDNIFGAFE